MLAGVGPFVLIAFDVLYLNGVDLAPRPLLGSCQVLKELLVDLGPGPRGGYEAGRL
jgi:ATP-dependent DNA ligase